MTIDKLVINVFSLSLLSLGVIGALTSHFVIATISILASLYVMFGMKFS